MHSLQLGVHQSVTKLVAPAPRLYKHRSLSQFRPVAFKFLKDLGLQKPTWLPSFKKDTAQAEVDPILMGSKASKSSGWQPGTPGMPRKYSAAGYDITPLTKEEKEQAAAGLSPQTRYIALEHGTERAFTGKTANGYPHDTKASGLWVSAVGGLPLFSSETKFDSGTGWPSFWAPLDKDHIIEVSDTSIPFMPRVEVLDARSGAHLGHVFNDGPRPTGKRYCMNAGAMSFIPQGEEVLPESQPAKT